MCPGFNRDGSWDAAQWKGDNLTRAANNEWVKLIWDQDIMLQGCYGTAPLPLEPLSPESMGSWARPRRLPPQCSP